MAGTDPVTQVNPNGAAQVNQRVEAVVGELAELIHDGHLWECSYNDPCEGTTCASDKARAVLAYLHGAGVLFWGQGHSPMPRPPEGATEAYAVRVMAEFWHPIERTPDDIEHEITRYHWVPGTLAVISGYEGERATTAPRTFVDELTPEQVAHLRPLLRTLLNTLDEV